MADKILTVGIPTYTGMGKAISAIFKGDKRK